MEEDEGERDEGRGYHLFKYYSTEYGTTTTYYDGSVVIKMVCP